MRRHVCRDCGSAFIPETRQQRACSTCDNLDECLATEVALDTLADLYEEVTVDIEEYLSDDAEHFGAVGVYGKRFSF